VGFARFIVKKRGKRLDKIIGIYYNMPMKKSMTDEKSEKYKKITRIFLEQMGYARTTDLQKKEFINVI